MGIHVNLQAEIEQQDVCSDASAARRTHLLLWI